MADKYDPGTAPPPWRVGEFWSSADPRRLVLMLAVGSEIGEYQRHRDFVRWVTPVTITMAAAGVPACRATCSTPGTCDRHGCANVPSGVNVGHGGNDGN